MKTDVFVSQLTLVVPHPTAVTKAPSGGSSVTYGTIATDSDNTKDLLILTSAKSYATVVLL